MAIPSHVRLIFLVALLGCRHGPPPPEVRRPAVRLPGGFVEEGVCEVVDGRCPCPGTHAYRVDPRRLCREMAWFSCGVEMRGEALTCMVHTETGEVYVQLQHVPVGPGTRFTAWRKCTDAEASAYFSARPCR